MMLFHTLGKEELNPVFHIEPHTIWQTVMLYLTSADHFKWALCDKVLFGTFLNKRA